MNNKTKTLSYNRKPCHKVVATPFLLFLILIPMLLSCSSSDEDIVSPTNPSASQIPVGFDNYIERNATRGTVTNTDNVAKNGFGVYAMMTDGGTYDNTASATDADTKVFSPLFMNNVPVTGTSSNDTPPTYTWTYSPTRYWPYLSKYYLSFLAYAPYQSESPLIDINEKAAGTTDAGDCTYIKYTVDSDPSKHIDWMYNSNSTLNMQCYDDADGKAVTTAFVDTDGKVTLNFKHATARIGFAITSSALADSHNFADGATESDVVITVNKFALGSRVNGGGGDDGTTSADAPRRNFVPTRAAATDDPNLYGTFYSSAYLNLDPNASVRWANVDVSNDNKVKFIFDNTSSTETVEGTLSASNQWSPNGTEGKDIKATRAEGSTGDGTVIPIGNSASDYMFIIPQDFSNTETSTKTYTDDGTTTSSGDGLQVSNGSSLDFYINYTVSYTSVTDDNQKSTTYSHYGTIAKNFEEGKAYLLLVDINSSLNAISFKVDEVGNWTDSE